MKKSVKEIMAELLTEWLFKDFGLLIDEPTSDEIKESLEEHENKREVNIPCKEQ
tara:strand:+ start:1148 stop:1309 length:162 start_codon:yes stop_codon:yes gene_type:complete